MNRFSNNIFYMLLFFGIVACSTSDEGNDKDLIDPQPTYDSFITDVFAYEYAPGQHSVLNLDANGSDFLGNTSQFVYLGGWGGYIVAGFDHEIENKEGYDFGIYTQVGQGSEPAVVYVMTDSNADGEPNDGEWIQLKGSEFSHEESIQNYSVTYFKGVGTENITWKDNQGNQGELVSEYGNDSHTWWWDESQAEVTFTGVKLPEAFYLNGASWVNYDDRFLWGYAENYQGEDHDERLRANLFDISNAVDTEGNQVELSSIKFIKVQTGVFQIAGHFNEVSTEIRGAFDYRMLTEQNN